MGLAASQARLLTITSRLSSVELKQQRIAMDKMRLANDQQGVSEKYTNALNNKTLSFSNGNQEVAMDYSTLTSNGYSVVRASDGLAPTKKISPSSASNVSTDASGNKVVSKPTCPRPEEIEVPQKTRYDYSPYTEEKKAEAKSWDEKLVNFKRTYGEYPTTKNSTMNELMKDVTLGYSSSIGNAYTSGSTFSKSISAKSLYDIANPSGSDQDYVVVLAQDGGKVGGYPIEAAKKKFTQIGESLIPKIAQTLGITSANDRFTENMKNYIEELKNKIDFSDRNRERDTNTAYNKAVTEARSGLVGNLTETYSKGADNDGYFLNLSEMVRRLMQKATSYYTQISSPEKEVLNKKTDASKLNESIKVSVSSTGYTQTEWMSNAKTLYGQQNYSSLTWNDALDVAENGYDKVVSQKSSYTMSDSAYQQAINEYNTAVANARAQWDAYDNYVNGGTTSDSQSSTSTSTSALSPSEEFYNQLQNSQFLIQGLLSGYLSLMKDGQQISLSSATNIIESYDKTDDAAAEAEYNSQMAKINSKEKVLDMQARRLDTEYSALQTEYESVKNIISNHTSKDFSYFS